MTPTHEEAPTAAAAAVDRRALIAGGVAAAVAAAVVIRPDEASASHNTVIPYDSNTVVHADVTNTTAGSTRISSNVAGTAAFVALNNYPVGISRPDGMLGRTAYTTSNCAGVAGTCEAAAGGIGASGATKAADGCGVFGFAGSVVPSEVPTAGSGVFGSGPTAGVAGRSAAGSGVAGETDTGTAVLGTAGATGIAGRFVGRTVVEGALETAALATAALTTSGAAAVGGALAVSGDASVDGELAVDGRARLPLASVGRLGMPQRSGVVRLRRAAASVSVRDLAIGPATIAIAVLQTRRRGLVVAAAVPSQARGRITIHFNQRAPKGTRVAWLLIN